MNRNYYPGVKHMLVAASIIVLAGCATISRFDQYAYAQSTSLKVDALNVMNLASQQYDTHVSDITTVNTAMDKMVAYERNRPKNELSEKMWVMLRDTNQNLYGGFIRRWKNEGTLSPVFIKESQILIGQAFDQVSQLESGKIKTQQATN
ncbi:hypothetical protein [Mucilaginibacter aquaedulcis]|uniref:hypothetical protein n=1 Tax=Mucilaginibacter aquaedulcis TaxID=1187081 RepID=UPI0025B5E936|nr:hypothetical protein [Mucilaginibacter aquaedulcis]MDN3550030.1 hypothetical protein [Mucilaginibacter aquaedulcis]